MTLTRISRRVLWWLVGGPLLAGCMGLTGPLGADFQQVAQSLVGATREELIARYGPASREATLEGGWRSVLYEYPIRNLLGEPKGICQMAFFVGPDDRVQQWKLDGPCP
ncbi:MAG: hypothetical protein HYV08_15520 [Deltaproteobacteria bacterium]|nr:hypothetical protein [Deltaproteobacteria bacterium]MBI3075970.1 hypothetical protein [Deltaproteobacteria bacterium]